jgi:hypothetical protein
MTLSKVRLLLVLVVFLFGRRRGGAPSFNLGDLMRWRRATENIKVP